MSVDQAFNFKAINDSISTAGLLSEEQLLDLQSSRYKTVINLLPVESEYSIKKEEAIVTGQDIDYFYIPVDFSDPKEDDYQQFVTALKSCEGKKTLIHCAANYRVSAFYAMYAYESGAWSASEAWQHITSIWNPDENPPWFPFISKHLPIGG